MFAKTILFAKICAHIACLLGSELSRYLRSSLNNFLSRFQPISNFPRQNIVIIGASFAGFQAAQRILAGLPRNSRHTVVVVEPHTHLNFTWVLPRFCVIEGHEHKAFIPYKPFIESHPKERLNWIQDRVVEISGNAVKLQGGEKISYANLVIAIGGSSSNGLPGRLVSDEKREAIEEVKRVQNRIKAGSNIVVVGGGATGVELVADAKDTYPKKNFTLIHSRDGLMHRFGPRLQKEALESLQALGINVILGERVVAEDKVTGTITMKSGKTIDCDCFVS